MPPSVASTGRRSMHRIVCKRDCIKCAISRCSLPAFAHEAFGPYLIGEFALSEITTFVLVDQTRASTFGVMIDLTTTGVPQKGKLSGGRIGAPLSDWVANTLPRS